jgi:hypothetical protein
LETGERFIYHYIEVEALLYISLHNYLTVIHSFRQKSQISLLQLLTEQSRKRSYNRRVGGFVKGGGICGRLSAYLAWSASRTGGGLLDKGGDMYV